MLTQIVLLVTQIFVFRSYQIWSTQTQFFLTVINNLTVKYIKMCLGMNDSK